MELETIICEEMRSYGCDSEGCEMSIQEPNGEYYFHRNQILSEVEYKKMIYEQRRVRKKEEEEEVGITAVGH
jgi:hypothetical protein